MQPNAVLVRGDRPRARIRHRLLLLLATALLVLPALEGRAPAQSSDEFLVDSVADDVDADVVDDTCDADPGPAVECTLRAAIIQANATGGEQVIRLQPRVYRLSIPGAREDFGFTGDLDVTDAVQIVGTTSGRARSTVDATGLGDRVLHSRAFAAKLQNLVITGGELSGLTSTNPAALIEFGGGGVRNDGELTLTNSVVRGNSAEGGGGIFNATLNPTSGSRVTIDRSTISGNRATSSLIDHGGGGILAKVAPVVMLDSTVENNTSASSGGGLTVGRASRIQRSLIAGNSAQLDGGGISARDDGLSANRLLVENSTVTANVATRRAGAIDLRSSPVNGTQAPLVLRAVTIAANRSLGGGGAVSEDILFTTDVDVEAINTLLANNIGDNCSRLVNFQSNSSFNLSTDRLCDFPGTSNQEQVGARLGALQFNGGPTRTHALLGDSPAIDAGPTRGLCPLFDQRGGIRPTNIQISNPGADPCDVGAFELSAVNVGRFKLTPKAGRVAAARLTTLKLTWWHPEKWRKLDTVDVQLRRKQATPLWVRFTQGAAKTNGISATNGLTLYNSDGTVAGVGEPGRPRVLRSDTAVLDLSRSRVRGSGRDGKRVTLKLAVRVKRRAAGKRYTTTVLARDDDRLLQGPNDAGTLRVIRTRASAANAN